MVANVGQVAGVPDPLDLSQLGPARSIALSRPGAFRFMTDLQHYREGAAATLARLEAGMLATIGEILPLHKAADAHRLLESSKTTGAILLHP